MKIIKNYLKLLNGFFTLSARSLTLIKVYLINVGNKGGIVNLTFYCIHFIENWDLKAITVGLLNKDSI